MNLSYDLINESNIKLATSIQAVIFPGESAREHYEYAIATNYRNCSYYIVKWNDIPVGITGIYISNMYTSKKINDNSVWLGWYGILPEFRSKGIGRQTLLDTIEKSKKFQRKYFRLYTLNTVDATAQPLYQSVMQTCESYTNEQDYNYNNDCLIYSYNLKSNEDIELWNNQYAYISEDIKMENIANKKIENYYKIFIITTNDPEYFMQIIKLATSFREDGHLVTLGTAINDEKNFDIIIKEKLLSNIENIETSNEILIELKNKFYEIAKNKGAYQ